MEFLIGVGLLVIVALLCCLLVRCRVQCYNLRTEIEELKDRIRDREYARQSWYDQMRAADLRYYETKGEVAALVKQLAKCADSTNVKPVCGCDYEIIGI